MLSVLGCDELFYGYNLTHEIPGITSLMQRIAQLPGGRGMTKAPVNALPAGKFHSKLKGIAEFKGSIERGILPEARTVFAF